MKQHEIRSTECVYPMHAVSNPIIQTSTVQGNPMSKFTVPIDNARVVSYSTALDRIIVSVIIFPILHVQILMPTESMVSYLTSFKSNIVSVFIFEIFDEKVL